MGKDYKKIYQEMYGKTQTPYEKLQSQINNTKTRLEAGGVKNPSTDSRNAIEKKLNLPEGQNFLFDIAEILNRPQQAAFGAVDAAIKGENIGEAALEHLKGNRETSSKDLLMDHLGMEDPDTLQELVAQGETLDVKHPFKSLKTIAKATDLVDVLGLAGDVYLDPMDLALIPVGGLGAVTGTGSGVLKVADNALDTVADATKAVDTVSDAAKAVDTVADATKTASKVERKSVNELLSMATKAVAKGAANVLDTNIEKGLKKLDAAKGITYLDEFADSAANLGKVVEDGSEYAKKLGGLEIYKSTKETLSKALKIPEKIKDILLTSRKADAQQDVARIKLQMLRDNELVNAAKRFIAKQRNKYYSTVDDVLDDVARFGEYTMSRSIDNSELLAYAKRGQLEGKDEFIDAINNMVRKDVPKRRIKELAKKYGNDNPLRVEVDSNGYIKLGEGFNNITLDTSGTTILKRNYTPDQQAHINKLIQKYAANEDGFADLVDGINGTAWKTAKGSKKGVSKYKEVLGVDYTGPSDVKLSVIDKANKIVDEMLGTNLSTKYNPLDNSDYVLPHVLTDEAQKLKGNIVYENLLSRRKHLGSIDEINEYIKDVFSKIPESELTEGAKKFIDSGSDFMETSLLKAFDNRYLSEKGLTGSIRKNKVANEVLLDVAFADFEKSKKLRKELKNAYKNGEPVEVISKLKKEINSLESSSVIKFLDKTDNKVPKGFEVIESSKLKELFENLQKTNRRYGDELLEKRFKKLASNIPKKGDNIAINADVARMLSLVSDDKTVSGLKYMYDTYLNFFKKWKTASPTFVMNSFIGNSSNLALSGISPLEQAKYGVKVADIMQNGEKYYKLKLAGEALDKSKDETAELWYRFKQMKFDRAGLELNEIPKEMQEIITGTAKYKNVASKAFNFVPHINNIINNTFDTSGRLVVMLKALDDPSYMRKLGVDNVYDAISKVMFDPTMLTESEKAIKNFIPFYTYSKNNLVFQATNLLNNPTKYNRTLKTMEHLQKVATDGNEENMEDYLRDSLYIPIPGLDADGNYIMLRASLPFGQLTDTISNPGEAFVSSLSPLLKAPVEYVTNVDSFTGREIEKFPGEKSTQLPFLTKKMEKALGDFTGFDVPLKNAYRIYEGAYNGDPIGGLMNTVTMQKNVDTDRINRQYEELDELQNLMKQYEQEGYTFSTINELKKSNKNNTIAELNSIFAKYGINQKTYEDFKYK